MEYRIITAKSFLKSLNDVANFYDAMDNHSYSDKLANKIREKIADLDTFPKKYALISEANDKEIRHFTCDRFRILYRIDGKNIYILFIVGSNLLNLDNF
jgi:mRNA-degrading endonuclease RelE of RelBE toxin-antitoxin system